MNNQNNTKMLKNPFIIINILDIIILLIIVIIGFNYSTKKDKEIKQNNQSIKIPNSDSSLIESNKSKVIIRENLLQFQRIRIIDDIKEATKLGQTEVKFVGYVDETIIDSIVLDEFRNKGYTICINEVTDTRNITGMYGSHYKELIIKWNK